MKKIILLLFSFLSFVFLNAQVACKPRTLWDHYTFNPGVLPEFPGGDTALQHYVSKNLVLSKKLQKDANGIVVVVMFDVDSLGKICNVGASYNSIPDELRQAAINLICTMPDWIPGRVHYRDDSMTYATAVHMRADIHFMKSENGIETPASIELEPLSKSVLYKPKPGDKQPFSFAERMPEFQGDYNEYVKTHIKYPEKEKELGKQGTVYLTFIVEKDGSISDVYAVKEVAGAPGLTDAAIDLISAMPKWSPGSMNGHPVRVMITQPVRFQLQ